MARRRPWTVLLAWAAIAAWGPYCADAQTPDNATSPPEAQVAASEDSHTPHQADPQVEQTAGEQAAAGEQADAGGQDGTRHRSRMDDQRLGDGRRNDPPGPAREWLQMLLALALVGGLIVLTRWVLRRLAGRTGLLGPPGGPLTVLARAPAGPRHQLLLVRMGRRVVMVGAGPEGMTRLAEAADAQEVDELLAACGGVAARAAAKAPRSAGDQKGGES